MNARFFLLGIAVSATIPSAGFAQGIGPLTPDEIRALPNIIKRGSDFLLQSVATRITQASPGGNIFGENALMGLALTAAEVPHDHPTMIALHNWIVTQAPAEDKVYNVALGIMFLDQYGSPADEALIQLLGIRLLYGQGVGGGWGYDCVGEAPSAADVARWREELVKLVQGKDAPKQRPKEIDDTEPEPNKEQKTAKLHPEVVKYAQALTARANNSNRGIDGDNSNTQFAIIGCWLARKHGVNIRAALQRIDQRFRATQDPQAGGWAYTGVIGGGTASTPSMTCAGLIGLAVAYGGRTAVLSSAGTDGSRIASQFARDPVLQRGLNCLGLFLINGIGAQGGQPRGGDGGGEGTVNDLYFLWSLERVGMAYGLDTIGKIHWYAWGARKLAASQSAQGGWQGSHGFEVSTCFAILFLTRCNLASELTKALRGRIRDPFSVTLKSGGATGEDLLNRLGLNEESDASSSSSLDATTSGTDTTPSTTPNPMGTPPKTKPTGPTVSNAPKRKRDFDSDASILAKAIAEPPAEEALVYLELARDAKEPLFTEALARAIRIAPKERGEQIREALAVRFTRMSTATIQQLLRDPYPEVRRAAAIAVAMRDDGKNVPEVIDLLGDNELDVRIAAHRSLRAIFGRDFGSTETLPAAARDPVISKWRAEWKLVENRKKN